MRKAWFGLYASVLSLSVLVGCHAGGSSAKPAEPETPTTHAAIPPDSIFAKVKEGMQMEEVYSIIGRPTSESAYITGKAFIPFHFSGSDDHRRVAHYKGVGTITFSNDSAYTSGMSATSIDYDPTEPGFERSN